MIQYNEKIFLCGNDESFSIKLKILNVNMKNYADCLYQISLNNNDYGIYNEKLLKNHDFIECNILRNDVDNAITLFQNKKNIIDLTNIIKKMSIEDALRQVIRLHYCFEMKDESEMNYSNSIDNFMKKISKTNDNVDFIMTGHASMQNYFLIPFLISNDIYISVIEPDIKVYENYDCSDDYDWKILSISYEKVEQELILNALRCIQNIFHSFLSSS